MFSAWHLFINLVFHTCSEHLISVNAVPLINLLHAFFLQQTFKALSWDPTDHIWYQSWLTVVQVCEWLPGPG